MAKAKFANYDSYSIEQFTMLGTKLFMPGQARIIEEVTMGIWAQPSTSEHSGTPDCEQIQCCISDVDHVPAGNR